MQRPSKWIGWTLVLAAWLILGYVGWQLLGTTLVSRHQQREHVERLLAYWAAEHHQSPGRGALPGEASALVRIPRFGASYIMPVLEGTSDETLSQGLGHFEGSARAGRAGNYALAGHRITRGEPFRALPDLRPGDHVLVETGEAVFTYVVDTDPRDLVLPFTSTWVVDERPVNPAPGGPEPAGHERLITLTTCASLFHTEERIVVFGHLQSVARKASS